MHSNEIKVLKRLCKNKRKYYYQVFRGKYYLQVKHRVAVKLSHGWLVVLLASFLSVLADFCRGLAVKQNQLSSFLSQRGKTFCHRERVSTITKFSVENIIFVWSTGWTLSFLMDDCYKKFNYPADEVDWPLCAVEIDANMFKYPMQIIFMHCAFMR